MPASLRVALLLPAALAGAAAGVLGSLVHRATVVAVPVGLLLGLALTVLVVTGAGALSRSRLVAVAATAGWFGPVLLFSTPRAEGDLLVTGGALGTLWLLGGSMAAVLAALPNHAPRGRTPQGGPSTAPAAPSESLAPRR